MDFSAHFVLSKHGGLHTGFAASQWGVAPSKVSRKRFPDG